MRYAGWAGAPLPPRSVAEGAALWAPAALLGATLLWMLRQQQQRPTLAGQVALITGGSRGLGLVLGRELAQAGCRLVICARHEAELAAAQAELARLGAPVLAIPCDVSDRRQVEQMIERSLAHYGQVDILVNNAGVIQVGPIQAMGLEDFARAMDVMYWGTVYTTLALLPHMLARRQGHIVNITSIGGKLAVPHLLPYVAAKFAATGFSEGLRAELAGQGVTVTTIAPGLMRTGSYTRALFKGNRGGEYSWFAILSSLPLLTIPAPNAARQIVEAIRREEAERVLGWPYQLAARAHGLLPGLTMGIAGLLAAWLLPAPTPMGQQPVEGRRVEQSLPPSQARVLGALTTFGRAAARQYQ
ncbi:MAG TPA: SDR family NAD(P)-dependent oxidoreductase [Caldilineaceae bacterium]|nr:SDR family NAD(P)-dependent oxidoreductase [Caldilineaceae bacterium]